MGALWTVPAMWKDGECFIIGGGPSILNQFNIPSKVIEEVSSGAMRPDVYSPYLSPLHGKHVIGINNAYQIGDWIDTIFFGDCSWYLVHRRALARWPGIKATCCNRFANKNETEQEGVKYLMKDKTRRLGISYDPSAVSWNGNSGGAAISLAVHFGVKRIYLLGFDMKLGEKNKTHWHKGHRKISKTPIKSPLIPSLPFPKHLKGFPPIARDAKARGIEIFNLNPDSAITVFPKIELKDIL